MSDERDDIASAGLEPGEHEFGDTSMRSPSAGETDAAAAPNAVGEPEALDEPDAVREPEALGEPETHDAPAAFDEPDAVGESEALDEPARSPEPGASHEPAASTAPEASAEPDIATDVTLTDREAAANDAAERARRVDRAAVSRWSVRALAGLAAAGLAATVLVTAQSSDASIEASPRAAQIQPQPAAQQRVCSGPAVRVGTLDGQSTGITSSGSPTLSSSDPAATPAQLPIVDDTQGGGVATLTLDGSAAMLGAVELLDMQSEAVRGLAASECSEPANDQWIVGGSTTTGRSSILTIANPTQRPASIDVRVFGAAGPVDTIGSTGIPVDPQTQIVLDLAGFAPDLATPVVRVRSFGAPVVAHVQQSVTRGLAPGGFDIVDAGASPARTVVVPGVVVAPPSPLTATEGFEDAVPTLRMLAAESGTVEISGSLDGQPPVTGSAQLAGGQVVESSLDELAPGTYTFTLTASMPFVAGARQTAVADTGNDLDWVASGSVVPRSTPVVVGAGPDPRIQITNTTNSEQSYLVDGANVVVGPLAQASIPASPGVHRIEGEGMVAAVTYRDAATVASTTLTPQSPAVDGVRVLLER